MSENTLVDKIKADTKSQVEQIQAESKAAVDTVEADTKAKVAALTAQREAELKKEKHHLELVAVSKAKQAGNIALQQAKRNQINQVFGEVEKELVTQDAASYVTCFTKLAKELLPENLEVRSVSAPKNREDETKEILKEAGLSGEITADAAIAAGLVVHSSDGVYDITLDRLMKEKKAALEMELVQRVMS